MISDVNAESKLHDSSSLLDDLMSYVYSGENCKMILIGDTAQLPPVNLSISPALMADTLELNYNKQVYQIELDEVMRQEEGSGVLHNATLIRELINDFYDSGFKFQLKGFKDIVRLIDGYDIQDAINTAYSNYGVEDTAFIVRSNKRANQYNQQIRTQILFKESELSVGDFLMVVKNNYFWLKETDEAGFVANGDIIEVLDIRGFMDIYTFKFAKVTIRMVDYPNQKVDKTHCILSRLLSA